MLIKVLPTPCSCPNLSGAVCRPVPSVSYVPPTDALLWPLYTAAVLNLWISIVKDLLGVVVETTIIFCIVHCWCGEEVILSSEPLLQHIAPCPLVFCWSL